MWYRQQIAHMKSLKVAPHVERRVRICFDDTSRSIPKVVQLFVFLWLIVTDDIIKLKIVFHLVLRLTLLHLLVLENTVTDNAGRLKSTAQQFTVELTKI